MGSGGGRCQRRHARGVGPPRRTRPRALTRRRDGPGTVGTARYHVPGTTREAGHARVIVRLVDRRDPTAGAGAGRSHPMRRFAALAGLSAVLLSAQVVAAQDPTPTPEITPPPEPTGVLATVQGRGRLICGVNGALPGF